MAQTGSESREAEIQLALSPFGLSSRQSLFSFVGRVLLIFEDFLGQIEFHISSWTAFVFLGPQLTDKP